MKGWKVFSWFAALAALTGAGGSQPGLRGMAVSAMIQIRSSLPTGGMPVPLTIEQILSAPFPTELSASPKGDRVAWFSNDQGRRNVWAAEGPQFRARALTHFNADDGQELTELTWSPDGEALVFVRGEGRNNEGEYPNPANDPAGTEQALWAVSFSGGLPRKIGSGNSPDVSAAGQVAFVSDGQIWSVPLSGSAAAQQLFKARGRNGSPRWSPDGKSLAFVSQREDHSFIGLYQPAGNTLRYIAASVDRDQSPRWSRRLPERKRPRTHGPSGLQTSKRFGPVRCGRAPRWRKGRFRGRPMRTFCNGEAVDGWCLLPSRTAGCISIPSPRAEGIPFC